ncbi:MAG: hypothetical protein JRI68_32805 [Deltaproteobacteria bacterium]|nr:hypothetical protein [Deltaproteobacteria bacterium]
MSDDNPSPPRRDRADEVESLARSKESGMLGEFVYFLSTNKKWWLTPIIVVLLLLGVLILMAGSGAAPFIYTVF